MKTFSYIVVFLAGMASAITAFVALVMIRNTRKDAAAREER